MITICSGIFVVFFSFSLSLFSYLAIIWQTFRQVSSMCVCFKFKRRVVVPGTKHKQKQKAQTKSNPKSKNEPKSTLYRCFSVFVGCVCAQRYSRYSSTPAASSSSLSRRVRIKRLSLANWASLSAERKTKPSQRERDRESEMQRERARSSELLPAASFYEICVCVCIVIVNTITAALL